MRERRALVRALGVQPGQQLAPARREVERQPAAAEHDDAAAAPLGAYAQAVRGPGEGRAERVGRVQHRKRDGQRLSCLQLRQLAQPLDGRLVGELGRAQAVHEPAPQHAARVLHGVQHGPQCRQSARHVLRHDGGARDDAVAVEQALGQREGALGIAGCRALHEGPAAREREVSQRNARMARMFRRIRWLRPASHAPRAALWAHGLGAARSVRGRQRAQGLPAVAGDVAAPGQLPERGMQLRGIGVHMLGDLAREEGAAAPQHVENGLPQPGGRIAARLRLRGKRVGCHLAQVQRHQAVAIARRAVAGPDCLAGRQQLVQHEGPVVAHARRQDKALPLRCRQRQPRQLLQHARHAGGALQRPLREERRVVRRAGRQLRHQCLPLQHELDVGVLRGGLRGLPRRLQRALAQAAQHVLGHPFVPRGGALRKPVRILRAQVALHAEAALEHLALGLQPFERLVGHRGAQPEMRCHLARGEGPVGARVPGDEVPQRIGHGLAERLRDARGQPGAQRVAKPRRVFDGGPALFARHRDAHGAVRRFEPAQPCRHGGRVLLRRSLHDGVRRERAELAQQVRHTFHAGCPALCGDALQLQARLLHHDGVEDLAHVHLAQQVREQAAVEREHRGAPLRQRRVALVHELGHVAEEQVRGEGGGDFRGDLQHAYAAVLQPPHERAQGRQVVDVLQAFPRRFDEDGEVGIPARDLQQLPRAQALLPQRRALARAAPGQQQRAGGALAKARGEQGRCAHGLGHDALHGLGVEEEKLGAGRASLHVRDARDDAVVARHHGRVHVQALADALRDGQRPGGMHALAVGRMQHDAPVPALVAAALDDQGAVGGQCARGLALLRGELEDVGDGVGVQARGLQRGMGVAGRGIHLAQECAYGLAQFRGAPQPLAAPERKPRGPAGRGNDDHLVVRDLLDAPGGRAQGDDVVHPGFVDHLLVQLAHAARARLFLALGQHDGEHAAVGNGAAADDGQALRARACAELPADPVPDEARAELGELVGRVAPGQHVQRGIERAARQRAERIGPAHEGVPVVHVHGVHGDGRHGLLRQHVERVAGRLDGFELSRQHAAHGHGGIDQLAPRARIDQAAGRPAHLVPRTPHALQGARDRGRRGHLDHQVHQAHVYAQLQAGGGHHAPQRPGLERVLDVAALLLRDRAVVRARDQGRGAVRPVARAAAGGRVLHRRGGVALPRDLHALGVQRVQPRRQLLRGAAGVGEHDGRAAREHLLQDAGLHVRPDRPRGAGLVARRDVRHVLHRHHDPQLQPAAGRRVHHGGRPRPAQKGRHAVHGPHGGGEAHALGRPVEQGVEPLQAQRHVRPALGARDRVHLVDDDRAHAAQRLACLRREHEVERFGRGDQDVGRPAQERRALRAGGVARAHAHRDLHGRVPAARALRAHAVERQAQVALHVGAQRLDGRDVEHAGGRPGRGGRGIGRGIVLLREQPVYGVQERRERLAGARRGDDQRAFAAAYHVPRGLLHGRGRAEGRREPGARGGRELLQRPCRPLSAACTRASHLSVNR